MDMKQPDQCRRTLLRYTGWSLVLTSLGLPALLRIVPGAAGKIADVEGLIASMKAIGQAYLMHCPEEHSRRILLELLGAEHGARPADGAPRLSWESLRLSIRQDFRTGNLVFLDGWTFSRTEARFYALAAV